MSLYIAIDVGGTNTRIGFSRDLQRLWRRERFSTPQKFTVWKQQVTSIIRAVIGNRAPKAMIVGVPGIVARTSGTLIHAPHLAQWDNIKVGQKLSVALKSPVFLENDTALGGLGEAVYGAGQRKKIVAYIAVGTGVGGARIVKGRLDSSAQGFEPGHQIIVHGGKKWSCGQRGCLDAYASGTAFRQEFHIRPEDCRDRKIWIKYVQWLGQGIVNIITLWSPDVVIVGGSMAKGGALLFPPLRAFVRQHLVVFKMTSIVKGNLGDQAGLLGGLHYLRTHKIKI